MKQDEKERYEAKVRMTAESKKMIKGWEMQLRMRTYGCRADDSNYSAEIQQRWIWQF